MNNYYNALPYIVTDILSMVPTSILCIGVGSYAAVLREHFPNIRIDALITSHNCGKLESLFAASVDNVYRQPAESLCERFDVPHRYDVIVVYDALVGDKQRLKAALRMLLPNAVKLCVYLSMLYPDSDGRSDTSHTLTQSDYYDLDAQYGSLIMGNNAVQYTRLYPHNTPRRANPADAWQYQLRVEPSPLRVGILIGTLPSYPRFIWETLAHELTARGHAVRVVFACEDVPTTSLPYIAEPNVQCATPHLRDCDVLLLSRCDQLSYVEKLNTPTLLYELGDDILYGTTHGEPYRFHEYLRNCYARRISIVAGGDTVAESLKVRYDRVVPVVVPGVNPADCPRIRREERDVVLLMGDGRADASGIDIAMIALQYAANMGGRFKVLWATDGQPNVSGVTFPVEIIDPIDAPFARADVYLHADRVDTTGYRVLAAFASGTAVVSGSKLGFMQDGHNCVLVNNCDYIAMADAVLRLLREPQAELLANAADTAAVLDHTATADAMDHALRQTVAFGKITLPK